MKCILMNQNKEVLTSEYNSGLGVFTNIYELNNMEYAPLTIFNNKDISEEDLCVLLSDWFKGRGIPDKRDYLDLLLSRLNITSPTELLDKAYGLSLSDQYWLKPYDSKIEWKDINFFQNDFNDLEFTEATFTTKGSIATPLTFKTPNNTTDGVLRKTWVIENNTRYLLKAASRFEVLQPFNEWLAAEICNRLGFNGVKYEIDTIKENIVSKCPCFINENTELIPAYQILHNVCNRENAYHEYVEILEKHGIDNAKEKVDNMFVLDYIMLNHDRHLNNFGIIRNVETLEWLDVAPIFDTGNSLLLYDYNEDNEVIIEQNGRFFYEVDSFDNIIKNVDNLNKLNISKLDGIVEKFDDLLHQYQDKNHLSDHRINLLCTMLNRQINKLSKLIDKEADAGNSDKSNDDYEL